MVEQIGSLTSRNLCVIYVLSSTNSRPLKTITDRCKNCYQPENCVLHVILKEDDIFHSFVGLRLHACYVGDKSYKAKVLNS